MKSSLRWTVVLAKKNWFSMKGKSSGRMPSCTPLAGLGTGLTTLSVVSHLYDRLTTLVVVAEARRVSCL
jgi:hypothetical protein